MIFRCLSLIRNNVHTYISTLARSTALADQNQASIHLTTSIKKKKKRGKREREKKERDGDPLPNSITTSTPYLPGSLDLAPELWPHLVHV